ncbi:MAG: aminotransferase class I/II-fold pyridoxal phosphate-dependent enzyme [Verrucomicrobiae bacterium]|nr:aminotransferase class I/II-fold pyridoxal phosphate-dependent enzyme [Verrucomicrobiae bacterium]
MPGQPTARRDFVASHVRNIPRSGIRDFFDIVQSMDNVISLGIGEPGFVTPWHIREAAIFALEKGKTSYTSNFGLLKLRRAISRYVANNFGVEYDPKTEILVTVGVSEALDIALRAIINPGDEVLYHEPCYVSYHPSVTLAHGVPRAISTRAEHGFRLRAEDVAAAIGPRTKALMLNFPTNPTGATMPREELQAIARLCCEHDLLVLSDEIYSELTYDGTHTSIAALPGMRERTIFLHGFSKAFAMTGFRIGYACAPADLIEGMLRVHQYSMLCASIVAQEAACEALDHGRESMELMREQYRLRRNFIVKSLREMGLECHRPNGAFYAFPDIRATGLTSREFAVRLLEEERVACVPGNAFGPSGEGYVRASYCATMSDLERAMERMARFVQRHRSQAVSSARPST